MKKAIFCILIAISISFNCFGQSDSIVIKNVSFNTKNDHFGVSFYKNEQLVVSSNEMKPNGKIKTHNKYPLYMLYKSKMGFEGEITEYLPLEMEKNATSFNIASSNFSTKRNYIYITTNINPEGLLPNGKPKPKLLRIVRGEYSEVEGWGKFEALPFCKPEYSYGHPSVSPDGKSLYFVSSMKGSEGRTDIYKVSILGNNEYGEPVQLGSNVNSRAKELYPYEGHDGYLYYSAKKKGGLGRLDIYKSKILGDGTYGPSQLLPAPINSRFDDYGLIINIDSKTGYFSSNRKGGKGGHDVYYFQFN